MIPKTITLRRGDNETYSTYFKDVNGDPYTPDQLAEAYFTVKDDLTTDDDDALFQKTLMGGGIDILDAETGLYAIKIQPADSAEAITGRHTYYWDVQVVNINDEVFTLLDGTLRVKADVTRRID